MNPYSHIVIASNLESQAKPQNVQEYYWGAIAPDIRYLAAMQRHQTHISPKRITGFIAEYPHLQSFLQGYLIHCLSDQVDLGQVFFQHLPFSLLKSKLSRQQVAVILELFYFEHQKVTKHISGTHNQVLSELGLCESLATRFSQSLGTYLECPSPESRISGLLQILGLEEDSRVEKYVSAANNFQKNRLLKNALYFGIRAGKINERIVFAVSSMFREYKRT